MNIQKKIKKKEKIEDRLGEIYLAIGHFEQAKANGEIKLASQANYINHLRIESRKLMKKWRKLQKKVGIVFLADSADEEARVKGV